MNPPEEKNSGAQGSEKKSGIKDFLAKPIVKSDSRYVQYSGLGIQLAAVILVFLWVGMKLDEWLNTNPWFTLGLTLTGFFAGFYSFYLNIKKLGEQDKEERKNKEALNKSYKKF